MQHHSFLRQGSRNILAVDDAFVARKPYLQVQSDVWTRCPGTSIIVPSPMVIMGVHQLPVRPAVPSFRRRRIEVSNGAERLMHVTLLGICTYCTVPPCFVPKFVPERQTVTSHVHPFLLHGRIFALVARSGNCAEPQLCYVYLKLKITHSTNLTLEAQACLAVSTYGVMETC
nr:hypothetical protein CFP56_11126 [Quercus suber]